ncbi:phosphotransferase [Streptomyces sp. NPDC017448]|uniref:phosphotransferase n=1 Tax=Streptomyces sp. NPDC017448 TaxID=3364996 RepID=UPI0037B37920
MPTSRQAVRQQWIDRHFSRLLGIPTIQVTSWTTGHGDLHVGNLLPPPLVLIDWEGWGRMPAGFDIGLFHAYSLTVPATAARIRTTFPDILRTEEGRIGELVALAQLLQVSERGGHPELTPHLARRAEQLTGIPVPMPPGAAV